MPTSEVTAGEVVLPAEIGLRFEPAGVLRMTIGERRSIVKVALYQASPLRRPGRHLSFLDGAGDEVAMVDAIDDLPEGSREVAREALRRRYLTARIRRIVAIRQEFGVTYWDVETDRGLRDFVVQSLSESCQWLGDGHLLFVDVDGNRFEIADRSALDAESGRLLDDVL